MVEMELLPLWRGPRALAQLFQGPGVSCWSVSHPRPVSFHCSDCPFLVTR